MASYIGKV